MSGKTLYSVFLSEDGLQPEIFSNVSALHKFIVSLESYNPVTIYTTKTVNNRILANPLKYTYRALNNQLKQNICVDINCANSCSIRIGIHFMVSK